MCGFIKFVLSVFVFTLLLSAEESDSSSIESETRSGHAYRVERRALLRESSQIKKNEIGVGWSYFFDLETPGVVMVYDHRVSLGVLSLGIDFGLYIVDDYWVGRSIPFVDFDDTTGYRKDTDLFIRARFGFHPLLLPAIQTKLSEPSRFDPYLLLRIGHAFRWSEITANGETYSEFAFADMAPGTIISIVDLWGSIAVGGYWHVHPSFALWGEIDWFRGVIGLSYTF